MKNKYIIDSNKCLKQKKSKTRLKHFTLNIRVGFILIKNEIEHKLLQVLVFMKQSAI